MERSTSADWASCRADTANIARNWSTSQSRSSAAEPTPADPSEATRRLSSSQVSAAVSTTDIQERTSSSNRGPGWSTRSCSMMLRWAARRTSSTMAVVRSVSATEPPRSSAPYPAACSSTKPKYWSRTWARRSVGPPWTGGENREVSSSAAVRSAASYNCCFPPGK